MEEKKIVKQENKESERKEEQKLSYEQLNSICSQLYQENQNLIQKIQQLELTNMFRRMDYLFKVVDSYNACADTPKSLTFDTEFVHKCVLELQDAITIPAEEKEIPSDE